MTPQSSRLVVLTLLVCSIGLLVPGLFAPVLTIRGVLTREGLAQVAPVMLERGLSDETVECPEVDDEPGSGGLHRGDRRRHPQDRHREARAADHGGSAEGQSEVEVYEQTRSIVSSVRRLYEVGSPVPATLILLFSVIVPLAKAALVAWATVHAEGQRARARCAFVETIAKWSMADVFVVALFIAYLAAQASATPTSGPNAAPPMIAFTAHFGPGFYWFAAYCLFSLASQQYTRRLAARLEPSTV